MEASDQHNYPGKRLWQLGGQSEVQSDADYIGRQGLQNLFTGQVSLTEEKCQG